MFIMSYLKLYFVILSLDEKYRFMDLRERCKIKQ